MPNPPSTGLPNPASYDTSTPSVVLDKVTGLMWQRTVDANSYTWAGAKAYCASLSLAGHSDWRLPTEIELFSLVDYTQSNPAIDTSAFPSTPAGYFWSSSPIAGGSSAAWGVDSYSGTTLDGDDVAQAHRVRCVRGGQVSSGSHYTVANGTVQDNFTGLEWQQYVDPGSYDWAGAKTYCASVGGGWRVPSVKELMTLVDFSVASPPTIDTAAFPGTTAEPFWSSSPMAGNSPDEWYVDFDSGTASASDAVSFTYGVICVR